MIFGVSHVILGSADVHADAALLQQRYGYTVQFVEPSLPTSPQKRIFMREDSNTQAMAFLRPRRGIPVELISYSNILHRAEPTWRYVAQEPLSASVAASEEVLEAWIKLREWNTPCPKHHIKAVWVDRFKTDWYWESQSRGSLICLEVSDLAASRAFFLSGLACAPAGEGDGWALCVKAGALPQWNTDFLLISRARTAYEPYLDGAGFRCISFLSSNIIKDNAALLQAGAQATTGVFNLLVNARPLSLALLQLLDGAFIELIQVARPQD